MNIIKKLIDMLNSSFEIIITVVYLVESIFPLCLLFLIIMHTTKVKLHL